MLCIYKSHEIAYILLSMWNRSNTYHVIRAGHDLVNSSLINLLMNTCFRYEGYVIGETMLPVI